MSSLILAVLLAARPFTPEELLATRRADDVQVSPDGKWASVTVRQKNLETNKDDKDIWLLPLAGGPARQFTRNAHSEHARWSPDGKQLLIVREGQLWIYELSGGDAHPVTRLSGGAGARRDALRLGLALLPAGWRRRLPLRAGRRSDREQQARAARGLEHQRRPLADRPQREPAEEPHAGQSRRRRPAAAFAGRPVPGLDVADARRLRHRRVGGTEGAALAVRRVAGGKVPALYGCAGERRRLRPGARRHRGR